MMLIRQKTPQCLSDSLTYMASHLHCISRLAVAFFLIQIYYRIAVKGPPESGRIQEYSPALLRATMYVDQAQPRSYRLDIRLLQSYLIIFIQEGVIIG